jgi:hypothetical protein
MDEMGSPKPACHIRVRLAVRRVFDPLGAADDHPDHVEQQDRETDQHERAEDADRDEQQADPERADLESVMRLRPGRGIVPVDVGDDDADQAGKGKDEPTEV